MGDPAASQPLAPPERQWRKPEILLQIALPRIDSIEPILPLTSELSVWPSILSFHTASTLSGHSINCRFRPIRDISYRGTGNSDRG